MSILILRLIAHGRGLICLAFYPPITGLPSDFDLLVSKETGSDRQIRGKHLAVIICFIPWEAFHPRSDIKLNTNYSSTQIASFTLSNVQFTPG